MFKIGLKLWSTNKLYIPDAIKFFEQGIYNYIELFAVPGSYDEYVSFWKALDIPCVIHAPHFYQGMCLSRPEAFTKNMQLAAEALKFADTLKASWVVFHSGVEGNIEETARQLRVIADPRVLIENKPRIGIGGEMCNGYSPEEIAYLKTEASVGFCLDIGHAICAANSLRKDRLEFLQKMNSLGPKMYHLTDGDWHSELDQHLHFGQGSYDFDMITKILPTNNFMVSIECIHDYQNSLIDFVPDATFLQAILNAKLSENTNNSSRGVFCE